MLRRQQAQSLAHHAQADTEPDTELDCLEPLTGSQAPIENVLPELVVHVHRKGFATRPLRHAPNTNNINSNYRK